ncbi:MAG: hypothetical protein COS71_00590 [Candidatus Moranbacteria bacterium CG06_land_8_20_14_3_00_40_12]|nr:MAG: hypothetical protein COX31_02530 [Candidatus Moranbacteria bacterium CG23_combo_of_CG06-09_8_20_14_all_40_16]PIU80992.1 MAG: hypothetical protein COS71_00590 [Candidatus Moranbacteria bacterium CG06_land_8_20_14_3_00_40_12]
MPNFKKLSIIIVNYQSELYLQKCLASLFRFNPGIDFEIVVVNNDEKEKLEKTKEKFPSVVLINSPQNNGFGAACNLGVRHAKGDLLFFLNPDTEVLSDNLSILLDRFVENKKIGVLGPKLVTMEGKTQPWCAGKDFSFWELIKNNFGVIASRKIWESENETQADWVSGAALFVRQELFDKIGGFDEKFFMYGEDIDLCRRIREEKYEVRFCPQASILHLGGKSQRNFLEQKRQYFKSLCYYLKKTVFRKKPYGNI